MMFIPKSFSLLISLLTTVVAASLLTGCEPDFAGNRAKNLNILNDPGVLRIVRLGGTDYLAVLNVDSLNRTASGSLQFYRLSGTADAPTLIKDAFPSPVEVPNNARDFFIDNGVLYIPDQNKNRVLIYDETSTGFAQRKDSKGNVVEVKVGANPERILAFSHASTGERLLAVLCKVGGAIYFINTSTLALYAAAEGTLVSGDPIDVLDKFTLPGTFYYTRPRQTVANKDDRIRLGYQEQSGFGIQQLFLLDGTGDQIFVSPLMSDTGVFSFNLKYFQNRANLAWDLPRWRDGESRSQVKGTEERGFRGGAMDKNGTIYLANRTDNRVYAVPSSEFVGVEKSRAGYLAPNTKGFDQNVAEYVIDADFDTNYNDEFFPRLGALVTDCAISGTTQLVDNCPGAGGLAATTLWVLGLGEKDKNDPALFKLDIGSRAISRSAAGVVKAGVQRLIYYPSADRIYVSNLIDNTITVVNADDLSLIGTVTTP